MLSSQENIKNLSSRYAQVKKAINLDLCRGELTKLEQETYKEGFWSDIKKAQNINKKISGIKNKIQKVEAIESDLQDLSTLDDLINDEKNEKERKELEKELESLVEKLRKQIKTAETEVFLNGEYDKNDAIVTIRTGVGGVDAADFSSMLYRMYTMWCNKQSYKLTQLNISYAEETGIKSVTFRVCGENAYGKLHVESGTHRLVRISPFNAQGKRQTSFSAVEVIPFLEAIENVIINDDEIKIDTYKSSGPGGQSVNTTDSAVRITHIPTGIVVSIQNEKSQLKNKEVALSILKSQLLLRKKEAQKEKQKSFVGAMTAAWGDHIRSYVLNPYKMVKDLRTNYETSDVNAVLDGEIDDFIDAAILFFARY